MNCNLATDCGYVTNLLFLYSIIKYHSYTMTLAIYQRVTTLLVFVMQPYSLLKF